MDELQLNQLHLNTVLSQNTAVCTVTACWLGNQAGTRIFLFATASRLSLGSTHILYSAYWRLFPWQ